MEQVGLGEVLSGPGFHCSPLLRARPHVPCLAALSRSIRGALGNPDSLPGPVPDSCSQTSPYCLRQMEPVTYRGELGRRAMVSCSRARFRKWPISHSTLWWLSASRGLDAHLLSFPRSHLQPQGGASVLDNHRFSELWKLHPLAMWQ